MEHIQRKNSFEPELHSDSTFSIRISTILKVIVESLPMLGEYSAHHQPDRRKRPFYRYHQWRNLRVFRLVGYRVPF